MSKRAKINDFDVDAVIAQCHASADEIAEALPALAAKFRVAGNLIRAQRDALLETDCKHTITYHVTESMRTQGLDSREVGKYCMTCDQKIDRKI